MLDKVLQLWPESLTTQALIVGVIAGIVIHLLTKPKYQLPPGPRGWPFIGSILDIRKDNMFKVFHKWGKEYGPIYTVQIGFQKVIILAGIDVVMEALVKKQADFAGRPLMYTQSVLSEGRKDIIVGQYGPRWKLHRKITSKAMRNYLTGGYLERKVSESVSIATDHMKKNTGAFDPFPYISLSVFNVLYGMCFNKMSSSIDADDFKTTIESLESLTKNFESGMLEDIFPPLRLCPTGKFKRSLKIFEGILNNIRKEVTEHRLTLQGNPRDLTDAILLAQKEAEEEEDPAVVSQITNTHVVQTLADVFLAGIDTSRQTLHWTLLALALHPDIQQKVHDEVDEVIDADLEMSLSDRNNLPYTEAVLHETMRLRPVAVIGVPHETLCDTEVGGYKIQKGTTAIINHYSLHHDSNQWKDVETFRPERFLDSSGNMAPKPDSWLPFSAGRRVCLGEIIAKPELHLILAGFMRAMSVSIAPGTSHNFENEGKGITNLPGRYKVVIKPRI